MLFHHRLLLLGFTALAVCLPAAAQLSSRADAVVTTPRVRAELIAHAPEGISPGAPVWAGLRITHQPDWHTYWKNPGDSGLPTELAWTLPPGVSNGDIAWPAPRKLPFGPTLMNYGYSGTVLLPVPLTVAPDFQPDGARELDLRLKASWLVCNTECVPEEGEFRLQVPLQGSTALHRDDFEAAWAEQPVALGQPGQITIDGHTLQVRQDGLPAAARGKTLEFFPETGEVVHTAAVLGKDWTQAWQGDTWTAVIPLADQRSASPEAIPFVLTLADADRQPGQPIAWRAEAPVSGTWPAVAAAAPAPVSPALQAALAANAVPAAPSGTLIAALIGALIGGLLLNLMPCVFPVLAIKVLHFTRDAQDRRQHRLTALAYTVGVIVSCLALGGAMLALRAAGTQLGWGFQLQSPAVVAALAALFTLIGLNLAGVFEFAHVAPASLASAQARHPVVNDFLSGVLVVAVASPCTAPFMGASLGFAIGLPAIEALLLFAALGLGLALPYLFAGFVPAVARALPKPGAWMQTLRRLLAFPMFATVVWLVWVLGQQTGIDGAGALLGLLVGLSAIVWTLTLRGRSRIVLTAVMLAATAALLATIGGHVVRLVEPAATAAGERWHPWSEEKTGALLAAGQPVFVDFTAAWCITCKYNERTTLADAAVLADFDAKKVALLRADWTRRDPAISAALTALGRSGVPVYVLHAPGKAPVVLTEILSVGEVRAALAAL
jgi:thiol:disulfide interchange protein DsbD